MNIAGNPTHKPTTDMQSRQGKAPKPKTLYQDRRIQDGQLKNVRIGVNFPWENLKTYVQGVLYRLSRLDLEIHMHIYSHMFTMNEIKNS